MVGNRIVGGASSGPSYAILFHSPDPTPTNKPAWDSNTVSAAAGKRGSRQTTWEAASGRRLQLLSHSPGPPALPPPSGPLQFDINQIFPPNNPEYRVVYVSPEADKETFK